MSSSKTLLAAAGVCFLLAFAVPTVAMTVGEDPTSDDIVLEPVDARYATLEDGEIVLDLQVYDDAVTRLVNVFTIEVGDDADDIESLWIDHDLEGVTFYGDGVMMTNQSRLEPTPGETITVGMRVDTHVAHPGTERFTVGVQYDNETAENEPSSVGIAPSATLVASDLRVTPTQLEAGDTVTAATTFRNVGNAAGEQVVQLTVDGVVVDQRSVALAPGEERTVTFERTMDWPGTHEIGISGAGSQSVTVEGPPIGVVNASVDDTTVTTGDSTTIRATVRNPTDRGVDRTLEVAVDGIVVDSRAVSIPANSEQTVTFEREFETAGTYEVGVSGVPAGEVTVEEPGGFSLQNRELSPATTAALAPPATAGLLFLAVAANRRWAIILNSF